MPRLRRVAACRAVENAGVSLERDGHRRFVAKLRRIPTALHPSRGGAVTPIVRIVQQGAVRRHHKVFMRPAMRRGAPAKTRFQVRAFWTARVTLEGDDHRPSMAKVQRMPRSHGGPSAGTGLRGRLLGGRGCRSPTQKHHRGAHSRDPAVMDSLQTSVTGRGDRLWGAASQRVWDTDYGTDVSDNPPRKGRRAAKNASDAA